MAKKPHMIETIRVDLNVHEEYQGLYDALKASGHKLSKNTFANIVLRLGVKELDAEKLAALKY